LKIINHLVTAPNGGYGFGKLAGRA